MLRNAGDVVDDKLINDPTAQKWVKAMAQVDELLFLHDQQKAK